MTASAGTALVATGHPPPGDRAGFTPLLVTGQLFPSLGSMGLLCEISALFVAKVTVEFTYGGSVPLGVVEVLILSNESSVENGCSLFVVASSW